MAQKTRIQAPIEATVTTAGVVNTTAGVYRFFNPETVNGIHQYVRPCLLTNNDAAGFMLVKINEADAAADDFHIIVRPQTTVDLSFGGIVNVETVSIWIAATAAYDDVQLHGWIA